MKLTNDKKYLIRRYLIWCYKTTKESLDRIDRKATQLVVDNRVLEDLHQAQKKFHNKNRDYSKLVKGFEQYVRDKKKDEQTSKFLDSSRRRLIPDYLYLTSRLKAVENSIIHFLGKKELKAIESLYEQEMIRRILQAREER